MMAEISFRCKTLLEKICSPENTYVQRTWPILLSVLQEKRPRLCEKISNIFTTNDTLINICTRLVEDRNSKFHGDTLLFDLKIEAIVNRLQRHPLWAQEGRTLFEFYVFNLIPLAIEENKLGTSYKTYPLRKFPAEFFLGTIYFYLLIYCIFKKKFIVYSRSNIVFK